MKAGILFLKGMILINSFLNIFLIILYSSFPLIPKRKKAAPKIPWITSGIRISCKLKRDLYIASKNNKDPSLITFITNSIVKPYQG
jgi:hypothetical protein